MKHPNRFYAAENRGGSMYSMGFANGWYVLVFNSRENRDKWLQDQTTLSSRKVLRREVSTFTPRPPYASHRSHLAITEIEIEAEGLIGTISYCNPEDSDEPWYVEKFKL